MPINVSRSIRNETELQLLIDLLLSRYSGGTQILLEAKASGSLRKVQEWVEDYLVADNPKTYKAEWVKVQYAIRGHRCRYTQKTITVSDEAILMLKDIMNSNIEVQSMAGAIEWLINKHGKVLSIFDAPKRNPQFKHKYSILKLKIGVYDRLSDLIKTGQAINRAEAVFSLANLELQDQAPRKQSS
jgi:predicted CopG family antitoxin